MKNLLRMYSGACVDPLSLKRADISIEDIAYHLAGLYRFNGGTRWTVAQHSYVVSKLAESFSVVYPETSPQLQALVCILGHIHDSPEAYTGDLTRSVKSKTYFEIADAPELPDLKAVIPARDVEELNLAVIMASIHEIFNSLKKHPKAAIGEALRFVHFCDDWLNDLETEFRSRPRQSAAAILDLFPKASRQFPGHTVEIVFDYLAFPKPPAEAERMFLDRFNALIAAL